MLLNILLQYHVLVFIYNPHAANLNVKMSGLFKDTAINKYIVMRQVNPGSPSIPARLEAELNSRTKKHLGSSEWVQNKDTCVACHKILKQLLQFN